MLIMKIYTQDRERILEMPSDIWVVEYGSESFGGVFSTSRNSQLGEYKTKSRAKEVVKEIFEYYRNGKSSYIMPLE